ncbi:lipoprotein [Vibrio sp. PP-XX7]
MNKKLTALLVFCVLALVGCGQTGPLYMPKDATHHEQSQP